MANGKIREKLCVFFTCILLIKCRNLQQLSGTQKTKDGGVEVISEQFMPDHKGFKSLAEYPGDDASVAELQKEIIRGQLVSSSEAALGAMSPKLRCGDDLMKLQLNGPEVAQVELCRDNGAPVSLTELPPHCGHTIPTIGGLVYATPYDGCGVMQQGGSYVIQIQWKGNSAVISCPVISTTANKTFRGPNPPTYLQILLPHSPPDALSSAADPMTELSTTETGEDSTATSQEMPKPPGYPQAFLQRFWPYYPHYHGKVYPTAKPTKPTVVQAPTLKPQQPFDSHMFWPYYHPHYHHYGNPKPTEKPVPTSMPTTTSVAQAPTPKPQLPWYPQEFWPYYYPHYHHGRPKSPEKPVPTSMPTTTSVAQAPTQMPQLSGYPQEFWPFHYPHGRPKPQEKPVPASMPATTSVAQAPTPMPQLSGYPQEFWPFYYPHYHHGRPKSPGKPVPTSIPTTTSVAKAPTQNPQLPDYPQEFGPYYYPYYPHYHHYHHYHHGRPKSPGKPVPTSMPTTTSVAQAPTHKPQLPDYPQEFWPYYYPHYHHYHHGKPKLPEKPVPTSMPTTTSVAQEPTQKPQIPGYPQEFWPYYYPHYHHGKPDPAIPTASPSRSSATTQKLQPPMYPGGVFPQYNYYANYPPYLQHLYSQYPVQPPKTPMPPITTTPQPCSTTAATECNQPHNEPPQYYIPPNSKLNEKYPFASKFVDLTEIDTDTLP